MKPSASNIFKKTITAIASAVIVNIIFIFIVKFFVHPPSTFSPFWYSLVALYTALGVAGAGVVYWIVTKYTSAYNRVFTWISIGTLLLSLIPDVGIYTNPGPDDIGTTIPIVIILMLTHVFAAYISVKKLTKEE